MKKTLTVILIISLSINVLKIMIILISDIVNNHKLKNGESCKYLNGSKRECENVFGKYLYKYKNKCLRNKCPSCTNKNKNDIRSMFQDNVILDTICKVSEMLSKISASILIIISL